MTTTIILGVLTFIGALVNGHFHDAQATRDRMLQDAEKQCFEVPDAQKNCSVLDAVTRTNLLKGQPLPVDVRRNIRGAEPAVTPPEPQEVQE